MPLEKFTERGHGEKGCWSHQIYHTSYRGNKTPFAGGPLNLPEKLANPLPLTKPKSPLMPQAVSEFAIA